MNKRIAKKIAKKAFRNTVNPKKVVSSSSENVKKVIKPQAEEAAKKIKTGVSFNNIDPNKGLIRRAGSTLGVLAGSAASNLRKSGNLKKAAIGTLQSSVASAGVSAGLAAVQGNDPWEAAKTGAVRGAMAGVGYQGLKAATHANKGSIKGNLKHMASTSKQVYQAHTVKGNAAMRQNGVSPQLKRVLHNNQMARQTEGIFGFNK
ncbi:hypothetical protein ABWK22_02745 [Gottfriedia acidiceleris]|uniref:hypothetical protein n=1 Tax=Gottfriedia acidiceleris TaxID=371036 RepID=UPI0033982000